MSNIKWIIITAPGGGVGQILTNYLLDNGYGVIGMGRGSSINFLKTLTSPNLHLIECDYTNETSMVDAFKQAKTLVDKIDGLVHLVGGSLITKSFLDIDLDSFNEVISVNTNSTLLAGREAAKWMKETGGGNIVFFGSTTGIEPSKGKLAYGVAKAAVHNMTLSFALEGSQYNILTNTIAPSYVLTQRHIDEIEIKAEKKGITVDEVMKQLGSKNPIGKILKTEELMDAVILLLTTKVIQGQTINVDLGQIGI